MPASEPPSEYDVESLDHPLWFTLNGPQSTFGTANRNAVRFLPDVSTLAALAPGAESEAWADLYDLVAPGDYVALFFFDPPPPFPDTPLLRVVYEGDYDQMVCCETQSMSTSSHLTTSNYLTTRSTPIVALGPIDAAEMLALVQLTEPGPFALRTPEVGRYLGVKSGPGKLVAMAGERARLPGWVEISAVCTHPDYRGRGYAERLVRELCTDSIASGNGLFLHVRSDNHVARRAYERIGFTVRRSFKVIAVQHPRPHKDPA